MNHSEELHLINEMKRRNVKAQREFYDRFAGFAMAVALRYIADRDAAKDVLQDSFVKMFDAIGSFNLRPESSLKSWVASVVAHKAVDALKNARRLNLISTDETNISDTDAGISDDTSDDDTDDIDIGLIHKMICSMPDGYRTVFNLFVFERKSHREIADILGISESTSASQFFHAKKQLRRMISEYRNKAGGR